MDIFSLTFLLVSISVFDEIVNGRLQASKRLINWLDSQLDSEKQPSSEE